MRLFLHRVVVEQAFPLELKVFNAETRDSSIAARVLPLLTNCLPILKKTAASKRAALPRSANYAKAFLKDGNRLSHAGRYDMRQLTEAMLLIANDAPLIVLTPFIYVQQPVLSPGTQDSPTLT